MRFYFAIAVLEIANLNAVGIEFGVKDGLNYASICSNDIPDSDITTDFHFSVLTEINVFDKFYFQPELVYSGQGSATEVIFKRVNSENFRLTFT